MPHPSIHLHLYTTGGIVDVRGRLMHMCADARVGSDVPAVRDLTYHALTSWSDEEQL